VEGAVTPILVRIVILDMQTSVWCDVCDLPCAVTVSYVEECDHHTADEIYQLTYCPACDQR
jgi:hypothetical protein